MGRRVWGERRKAGRSSADAEGTRHLHLRQLREPRASEAPDSAFCDCESLETVSFAKGSRLETIGCCAFCNTRLKTFTAPRSLRYVFPAAFADCGLLRRVTLNAGLEMLGMDEAFEERCCYGVFEDSVVERVKFLPARRAKGRGKLERIECRCFLCCQLRSVMIPSCVTAIGPRAFCDCARLRLVAFEAGSRLARVEDSAFAETALETFLAPASLREIGKEAFCGCKQLRKVTFEAGSALERVEKGAFWGTKLARD